MIPATSGGNPLRYKTTFYAGLSPNHPSNSITNHQPQHSNNGKTSGLALCADDAVQKDVFRGGGGWLDRFPGNGHCCCNVWVVVVLSGWWTKTTKRVIPGTVVFASCRLLFCFCIRVFIICSLSCLFACTELVLMTIKQLLKAHLLIDIFATILTSPGGGGGGNCLLE